MNKALRWILGIVIALVVVGMIAAIGFLAYSRWTLTGWAADERAGQLWSDNRRIPGTDMPWHNMPGRGLPWHGMPDDGAPWRMMPQQPGWRLPGSNFYSIFPLRGIFIGLICLGVIVLLVGGGIALALGLRKGKPTQFEPAELQASQQDSETVCPNCSRPVSADWNLCAYCGTSLTSNATNSSS